ncbi:MAG: DUF6900 domain-containing protein [Polyangiales bacterium]
MTTKISSQATSTLLDIARRHLRLETLETRNMDSLDFHELSVASIQDALEAAYLAGAASTKRRAR